MQNVVKIIQKNTLSGMQISVLNQALDGLNNEQLSWVSGYVSGLQVDLLSAPATAIESTVLTILYASQGGNARSVAASMAANAENCGFSTQLLSVENYRPRNLLKETYLLVVISTQGEGEPPEAAQELFHYLSAKKKPKLDNLQYAIFGLGDSSYEYFCKAAQDMDSYFQDSGAMSLLPRVDADVSFQTQAEHWGIETLQELEKILPFAKTNATPSIDSHLIKKRHDSSDPYQAEVLENRRITSPDSVSTVQHIALEIDPNVMRYQPGDAVAVFFQNAPDVVFKVLQLANLSGDAGNLTVTELVNELLAYLHDLGVLHLGYKPVVLDNYPNDNQNVSS